MHDESHAGHRHERLEELLLEEVRSLLSDEVEDPRLERVTVASVKLSVDYRHLRVNYTLPDDADARARAAVDRAFQRASAFFRARLADAVDLKRVPDLRFVRVT